MTWLLALTIWVTLSTGLYLTLSRDLLRCVLGLAIVGSGANLLLFLTGRIGSGQPPVVPLGETVLSQAANPLPQALVLTAIVIGFALMCFSLVLVLRLIERQRTDDVLDLRLAEPPGGDGVKPPLPTPAADAREART
ncbi:cation:proton antiporter [Aquabacterium fontiphilum]|uniref:sodium:proton antiporter n=1 Tax=Aquabacterium fontiphilum TaxID=450365 RepID=UPI001377D623|nr:NADH-quinone oxidoreductase subunit K [Aquabacterium fontiphilum]NBD21344.1 cation:proton antiporter [Aquabacterium fontiphilum]